MVRLVTAAVCVVFAAGSVFGANNTAQINALKAQIKALRAERHKEVKTLEARYNTLVAAESDGAKKKVLRQQESAEIRTIRANYHARIVALEGQIRQLSKAGGVKKLNPAKPKMAPKVKTPKPNTKPSKPTGRKKK